MKEEIKCSNCKEGKELQVRLTHYPEDFEMYKCEVCSSVWEREKHLSLKELLKPNDEKQIVNIRLNVSKGGRGSTIQVNYGNGWENIEINIEE